MTIDEAKTWVKNEVEFFQLENKKNVYLQKNDYFFFVGALVYAEPTKTFDITQDIKKKLSEATLTEKKPFSRNWNKTQ